MVFTRRRGVPRSIAIVGLVIIAVAILAGTVLLTPGQVTSTTTPSSSSSSSIATTTTCLCPTAPAPCPCASTTRGGSNSTSSSSSSSYSAGLVSTNSTLVAQCPNSGPESAFGTVTAGTSTPALLCVRLFYYSTIPLTVNLTAALSIQALQYIANGSVNYPRSFSGASNFTVTASQSQLTMGGPNNENEGATIAYGVTAKSGSSGTYWLSFLKSSGLSAYVLDPQEPMSCAFDGELVAGSGQPDYTQGFNGCITYTTTNQSGSTTTTSSTSTPTVPGIPYSLTTGYIYFEIVGAAGSPG
jgi:hypothetical protein